MVLDSCHDITKSSATSGQESVGIDQIYATKADLSAIIYLFPLFIPFQEKSNSPPNPDFLWITPQRARRLPTEKSQEPAAGSKF